MTLKLHALLQILLLALQGINGVALPLPHATAFIALAIAVIQAALAFEAHLTNPDGSPAAPETKGKVS